jgi:hypothetical protein
MSASALPAWIPKRSIYAGARVLDGVRPVLAERCGSYRLLGKCEDRDALIYVRSGWWYYAKLELVLQAALHFAVRFLCRQRILVGPEGSFFCERRLGDPAFWRWL